MSETFRCYLVEHDASGGVSRRLAEINRDDLPPGEVVIRVAYSSMNYKDALAATGHRGVAKKLPHVPGIDAAGEVVESTVEVRPGDRVIVTGYELGAGQWGGYSEFVRVPGDWIVELPEGLSQRESMILGTAGFTAALAVDAICGHSIAPGDGPVAVTGASGGVGSLSVELLAKLGYEVAAVSGKPQAHDLLKELGAATILSRDDVNDHSGKPLLSARFAAAVDTVGGNTLATLLASTRPHGCVAVCGLVGGAELHTTVFPFILRGVVLAGVDSAFCPLNKRREIWNRLAGEWRLGCLDRLAVEISLEDLDTAVDRILAGETIGRTVVRICDSEQP